MKIVPLRFRALCVYCQTDVDVRAEGVYSLQTGWMKNRSQGGGNALALREPVRPLSWACHDCIDRLQHGQSLDQQRLFG